MQQATAGNSREEQNDNRYRNNSLVIITSFGLDISTVSCGGDFVYIYIRVLRIEKVVLKSN
jgi:hypothetical protein